MNTMRFPTLRIMTLFIAPMAAMVLAPPASANISGVLDVSSGCADVSITAAAFDWGSCPQGSPISDATANFVVGGGTTLEYEGTPVAVGLPGHLLDLSPGSIPTPGFMTIDTTPLGFTLDTIGPGPSNTDCATLALFGSCSPFPGSPLTLQLLPGNQTGVLWAVGGTVTDGVEMGIWSGAFTSQITNMTPAQIQSLLLGGGSVTSTHSASFNAITTSVPEPETLMLLGSGLLTLLLGTRRRRR